MSEIGLAVELARRTAVDARLLRAEKRGARVLVEFPSHIVGVALDKGAAARLARERTVLSTLAGRLPVTIPIPVAHCGRACLRTKVVGRSGVEEHMRP